MKIAIASSGLGHVARGIETWARDTAEALAERGVEVTLFAAEGFQVSGVGCQVSAKSDQSEVRSQKSEVRGQRSEIRDQKSEVRSRRSENTQQRDEDGDGRERKHDFTEGNEGNEGKNTTSRLRIVVLDCLKRSDRTAQQLVSLFPGFTWRWGLKSPYGWEQFSFWWKLWPRLRRGKFDILHVQDPMLAYWCRKFRTMGLLMTREILAHGTEEPIEFLSQFEYVQHLAPYHLEQARNALAQDGVSRLRDRSQRLRNYGGQAGVRCQVSGKSDQSSRTTRHFTIPNFVDVDRFKPDPDARRTIRRELGIVDNAFVGIGVGALKRDHKRVDWLIGEFARFAAKSPGDAHLLLAGASTPDTPALATEAGEAAGGRIHVLPDQPRDALPGLLAAADVFVHGALFEMMPIAFLEAAACGLPIISHGHPVMQWMAGEGRLDVDMTATGALAVALEELSLSPGKRRELGGKARERTVGMFSKAAVMDQYIAMYKAVMGEGRVRMKDEV